MTALPHLRPALPPRRRRPAGHGIALVLVLWLLTLLTAIAAAFVIGTRANTVVTANLSRQAEWAAAADAGVHRAAYELLLPAGLPGRWEGDGLPHTVPFGDGSLEVAMVDELGKVDLNAGHPDLLRLLFMSAGLDDAQARALVDVLADWRDPDTLRRPAGAEADEYARAGSPYRPANASLQTVDEFRQLLGVDETLFRRLAPHLTVYSAAVGIQPAFAAPELLAIFPGATPELIAQYLAQREAAFAARQPPPDFAPARGLTVAGAAPAGVRAYTVRSTFRDADGVPRYTREAVLRLPREPGQLIAIAAWTGGNAPAAASAGTTLPKEP